MVIGNLHHRYDRRHVVVDPPVYPSLQDRGLVAWMALGLLCTSATFAVWTSGGGLETRQFTFFIVIAIVCLTLYGTERRGLLAASLFLAAAELTRPEGLMLAACCFTWFAVQRMAKDRRIDARLIRELIVLVTPFVVLISAHFLFRYAYYGEWLPNTYYAKHVRPWYESGFRYLSAAALETGLYLLLPLAFFALHTRWRMHQDGTYALALVCIVLHIAYLLRIGGDHFEYRPLDFYWPLLALPAAEGIALFGSSVSSALRTRMKGSFKSASGRSLAIAFFLLVLFYASALQGSLLFKGAAIQEYIHMLYVELNEENAEWLLAAPGMPMIVTISNDLRREFIKHAVARPAADHHLYANKEIRRWKPYEELGRGIFPEDALMASTSLGKFYYLPDLRVLDLHGLTDATVARTPVTRSNRDRAIAHDRWPTSDYLVQRGVNFTIYPLASSVASALMRADYAVNVGSDLWMPFNTVTAQWADARFGGRDLRARNVFSTIEPGGNLFNVRDYSYVGQRFLGHFENGLDGWQLEGEALSNYAHHPRYEGQPPVWRRADSSFLTSYHPSKGNMAIGRAISPEFSASHDQYLAFLIAGGGGNRVGLRLLANGAEVMVWRGMDREQFELILYPLAHLAGESLQLELFDNELGDRGHIMLDHVMLVVCDTCPEDERMVLARSLSVQPTDDDTVYLVPSFSDYPGIMTLYMGTAPVHIIRMDDPNLAQEIESRLAWEADKSVSMVKVIEWNTVNRWIDDNTELLTFLLGKYGRYLSSIEHPEFRVHTYVNVSLVHAWTLYEQLEPLAVDYDGGITLAGLALGQNAEQLPSQQIRDLGRERSLWGVLQWKTDSGLDVDFAISLRLYDTKNKIAYQADDILWNPPQHTPTSQWPANESVDSLVQLRFPSDLPPGDYELRLVVYNFETLEPTVQQGVWEPEITLTRLRLTGTK